MNLLIARADPADEPDLALHQDWRNEPATDDQLDFLSDLVGLDREDMPEGLTKGQASDYIDMMKAKGAGFREKFLSPQSVMAGAIRSSLEKEAAGTFAESRLYRITHRVADRLEPELRAAFLEAVKRQSESVDMAKLRAAFERRDPQAITQALGLTRLEQTMQAEGMERPLRGALMGVGEEVAGELASEMGVTFSFDSTNPRAVMAARSNAATMVTRISNATREGIREVVEEMFTEGIPPRRAAPQLRNMVGLAPHQSRAVHNFSRLLVEARESTGRGAREALRKATDRRLDAATKQRIRSAARKGELTDEFINEVSETYSQSMNNRRALNIARTETIEAANAGQQETWRQAADEGVIDSDRARRVAIVTPDDRLRASHAAVPSLNEGGVRLEEPFVMPDGSTAMYPPWPHSPVNCRCSTGLMVGEGANLL